MKSRIVTSKQVGVQFLFCPSPIVIDKRADWGQNAENLQQAPNGAFLKTKSPTEVSHLVQPKPDKSAPIGWIRGSGPGLYDKEPIWVDEEVLEPGTVKVVKGLDGEMRYEIKEPSRVCYNDLDGAANPDDAWVQTMTALEKNYNM